MLNILGCFSCICIKEQLGNRLLVSLSIGLGLGRPKSFSISANNLLGHFGQVASCISASVPLSATVADHTAFRFTNEIQERCGCNESIWMALWVSSKRCMFVCVSVE